MSTNFAKTLRTKKGFLNKSFDRLSDCLKDKIIDRLKVKSSLAIVIDKYENLKPTFDKLVRLYREEENNEAAEAELNKMDEIRSLVMESKSIAGKILEEIEKKENEVRPKQNEKDEENDSVNSLKLALEKFSAKIEDCKISHTVYDQNMKNDEKSMKKHGISKIEVVNTRLCEKDEITKLEYSQIPSHEDVEVCKVGTSKNDDGLKNRSYKHEICNEIFPEPQEHKDVFTDEPREKGNEISQKKVEDVITITDRFTCDCDSCMCTENDSTSIKELTEDFLDWTKVWLEMCEKSPGVHCNISANKINDGKNIINNENGTKMKESHQNVKKPKKSQKRTTKTKQTKSLNRVQYVQKLNEETRYKMKIKSPKKNGRCKTLEMEYTRWKYMYDKVKSSKNVRSKSKKKKNMNLSSYTSVYRKETEMKSEKIILVNTKMKFRSHRKKLSKFKYRRKKRSIRGHTRTFTIKRVNSRLEKKYISRRLSRSTKKVKLKDRNYYQFIKRCYKLIVLKHRLKKPWKKKTKAKLKRKIIGKKVRDIMILKNGDIGAQGAGKEQQLKFIKYRSICWGCSLVGCGARNGYNRECPKYSLTSLNGGGVSNTAKQY